ncbi:MAG TPA: hypothetical protein VFE47_08590 [Tepidisphaeraceae bacterium]|jgi:hypothetical protein|nr:hypothetical protein [Tepidisphaeraceae bacterium]
MIDELKRRVCERPFKAFRVVLRDGRRLDVTRIAQLGIGKTIFGYADDTSGKTLQLPIELIVSLETIGNVTAA